jgi:hypothetical protein
LTVSPRYVYPLRCRMGAEQLTAAVAPAPALARGREQRCGPHTGPDVRQRDATRRTARPAHPRGGDHRAEARRGRPRRRLVGIRSCLTRRRTWGGSVQQRWHGREAGGSWTARASSTLGRGPLRAPLRRAIAESCQWQCLAVAKARGGVDRRARGDRQGRSAAGRWIGCATTAILTAWCAAGIAAPRCGAAVVGATPRAAI